jgi:hypothetical protein
MPASQAFFLRLTIAKKFRKVRRMKQIILITDTLGSEAMQRRLGVSHHAIRAARTAGKFPAAWYDVLDGMCRDAGLDCPRSAFTFKSSSHAPSAEGDTCS